ncbi:MAG: hypothetical protein LBC19_02240 [Tannerella sp.]|jgi:hypothetical protein|nr:hypothetical protein [Tannerella sp.]
MRRSTRINFSGVCDTTGGGEFNGQRNNIISYEVTRRSCSICLLQHIAMKFHRHLS